MQKILIESPSSWFNTVYDLYGKKALNVTIQLTEDCCMACTYCYQHKKSNNKMTFETAKQIIDNIFNNDNFTNLDFVPVDNTEYSTLILDFIGGEPLMEVDLIDAIMDYTLTKMIETKNTWITTFRGSICSNGLLYFTPKVQNLIQKYNIFLDLSFSIDGNKELHDSCRLDLQGNGTYERIIAAVKHYRENYGPMVNTKLTISPNNIRYLSDAVINLINLNFSEIFANCIFEEGWNYTYAKILYNELKKIGDYLINNNLYDKVFFRFFSENYYLPLDENENNNWCGGVLIDNKTPGYYAINYTGNIYPCIRYMESSLNNKQAPIIISDIYHNKNNIQLYKQNIKLLSNITRRSQSTDKCFSCPIAAGCSWCSAYNYEEFGTPNKRATYICEMHQAAALANTYFLNKLYQTLNMSQRALLRVPKEWALNIIDEKEYNFLYLLSQE